MCFPRWFCPFSNGPKSKTGPVMFTILKFWAFPTSSKTRKASSPCRCCRRTWLNTIQTCTTEGIPRFSPRNHGRPDWKPYGSLMIFVSCLKFYPVRKKKGFPVNAQFIKFWEGGIRHRPVLTRDEPSFSWHTLGWPRKVTIRSLQ